MTREELALFRNYAQNSHEQEALTSLLDEVERLRGLLREWSSVAFDQVMGPPLCPLCWGRGEEYATIHHKPDCIIKRTRAALEDTDHAVALAQCIEDYLDSTGEPGIP